MEAFILISTFMFIMGSLILLVSGIISFFFPKVHFMYILGGSAITGAGFAYLYELGGLVFLAVILNVFLSAIAIGLAKYSLYLKSKAELEADSLF
ncbi:hypothetical protein [Bacillus sp. FJAT-27445]|uniref:hypothetical protein n=1 Tax=Bacillus sp. FJAT-27445 TaxID=1679166 RepID=UPI00074391D2|nr:hypothetical protein [Bacillus sp. FJAT-27445]